MTKSQFYGGMASVFLIVLYLNYLDAGTEPPSTIIWKGVGTFLSSLLLSNLLWLGTRWQHGHWESNALNPSPSRRRFLCWGTAFFSVLLAWAIYLDLPDRILW